VIYLILLQISFFSVDGITEGPVPYIGTLQGFFLAVPVANFAFASQNSFYSLYAELKTRGGTPNDMTRVSFYTGFISTILYMTVAVIGILAFPDSVEGNIMLNFDRDIAVNILLISMSAAILFGYPLTLFVLREIIDDLLFSNFTFSYIRFAIEAIFIIGASYSVAVLIPSFIRVLGLFGSVTKVFMGQIFPSLFYLQVGRGTLRNNKRKWLALILLVVGGALGVASAVITFMNFFNN